MVQQTGLGSFCLGQAIESCPSIQGVCSVVKWTGLVHCASVKMEASRYVRGGSDTVKIMRISKKSC